MVRPKLVRGVRRAQLAAAVSLVVVVVAAVVAVARSDRADGADDATTGRTFEVTARDLTTTLEDHGAVERLEERTISYSSSVLTTGEAEAATTPPTSPTARQSSPGGSSTASSTTTVPPTTSPPTTTRPSSSTTSTTVDERGGGETTSTSTTTPASSTSSTSTTKPNDPDGVDREEQAPTATTPTTTPADQDPRVLTGLLGVGAAATRGSVLYRIEDEPTVALIGPIPAWRPLEVGVDDGDDVRQLEENLAALGYGSGVTVDRQFTEGTAAAVERWEKALGRSDPDAVVDVGEVLYLSREGDVLRHDAVVGQAVEPGDSLLTVGSVDQHLAAIIDADDAGAWVSGHTVELTWADGSKTGATVHGTSRDVTDGTVELVIALGEADRERPSGSEADITIVDAERRGVLAVPVTAVVAAPDGSRAVRIPAVKGADRLQPIETGIVAGGWIEIVGGLAAGDRVRVPS